MSIFLRLWFVRHLHSRWTRGEILCLAMNARFLGQASLSKVDSSLMIWMRTVLVKQGLFDVLPRKIAKDMDNRNRFCKELEDDICRHLVVYSEDTLNLWGYSFRVWLNGNVFLKYKRLRLLIFKGLFNHVEINFANRTCVRQIVANNGGRTEKLFSIGRV